VKDAPVAAIAVTGAYSCRRGANARSRCSSQSARLSAREIRRAGGFAKDTTPFSEFLWADALRRRVKRKMVEGDFGRALETALKFAKSQDAIYLPGWCGPAPEN